MDQHEIENRFTYHAPSPDQAVSYGLIRGEARHLAKVLNEMCPESREKSLAMTALEEMVMWANASIARRS